MTERPGSIVRHGRRRRSGPRRRGQGVFGGDSSLCGGSGHFPPGHGQSQTSGEAGAGRQIPTEPTRINLGVMTETN